jgi:hypothetical protein
MWRLRLSASAIHVDAPRSLPRPAPATPAKLRRARPSLTRPTLPHPTSPPPRPTSHHPAAGNQVPQHQRVRGLFRELLESLPSCGALPRFHPLDAAGPPAWPGLNTLPPKDPEAARPVPPHISLSRTVPIRLEEALPLLASLRSALAAAACGGGSGGRRGRGGAAPGWTLTLRGVRAFSNDERTRTFAAVRVDEGADQVRPRGLSRAHGVGSWPACLVLVPPGRPCAA